MLHRQAVVMCQCVMVNAGEFQADSVVHLAQQFGRIAQVNDAVIGYFGDVLGQRGADQFGEALE